MWTDINVRYLQGSPLFWAPYHGRPCMPTQFYPVRSHRLRSALPPACFRQITAPSTDIYAPLFSAADKVFPQISNLECNTVPVTDPNAFTLSYHYNVLKLGLFGQQIRNTWKVLKCGAGEGWRRPVGPTMWEMKKCYLESMSRGISYMK